MRPIINRHQLRIAIRMRVADAYAEGGIAGALLGAALVYLFT